MAGFEAPIAGPFCSTRNDARYPRLVTVHYPLHPFFGRKSLTVRQRCGAGEVEQVIVEFEKKLQAIPLWMTDEEACGRMTIGIEPMCSLASLVKLHSLLQSTGL